MAALKFAPPKAVVSWAVLKEVMVMQFSEQFRRWLKSFMAALAESRAAADRGDAMVAVPISARRPMSIYDYNNLRDYPVVRHWSGRTSDD
jgi:hypothetical protein